MFDQMTLEQFLDLARRSRRVVVHRIMPTDRLTPISAYQAMRQEGKAYLLESATADQHSFIGCHPRLCFQARGTALTVQSGDEILSSEGDPIACLRSLHAEHRAVGVKGLPPLVGGAIGFFSYDAVRYFETVPDRHAREDDFPDLSFTFFDSVVAFDHHQSRLTLSHVVEVGDRPDADYQRGIAALDQLQDGLQAHIAVEPVKPLGRDVEVQSDLDDAAFASLVRVAKEAILAGEVFQLVLSRRFTCRYTVPPFDVYRAMRLVNPSPFMFFLDEGHYALAGASPERLVSLRDRKLETAPLAGTRPLGNPSDDARLCQELLSDPKELAEHLMLVDLGRNDLGRVSKPGTVKVEDLKTIVRHGMVMHIQSRVVSQIEDGLDALDALGATLPAGTLSGAPKIRAMELIDELEGSRRGLYGGGVGYLSADGELDCCIAIRAAHLRGGRADIRVGAGIVADSIPENEAKETRHKVAGVLRAIALAEGGLP